MKRLFTIILLLASCSAYSQVQEGTIIVGGGLNFSGQNGKNVDPGRYDQTSSQGNIGISGSYEKFHNSTTTFGFFLGYNYNSYKYEYDFNSNTDINSVGIHLLRVGPQMTKYVPISDKLYFTVRTGASFGIGRKKDKESDEKTNIWQVGISASPGLEFFLNDKFALSASIGSLYYNYSSEKSTEENASGEKKKISQHSYGFSFNVNTFTIGLKYFLRTAKTE